MSDQSNYDRRVKDILDRVANGHLTSEEAATLIAAIPTTSSSESAPPTPGASGEPSTPAAEAEDEADSGTPSAAVWAEVVDTPDTTIPAPGAPKHAAEPSQPSQPAEPTVAASGGEGSVVDDAAIVREPERTAEPPPAAESVVQDETLHSNLVVPAGVRRVTIRAIGRRVRLIGEPAVTGVAVDGPHVIKRDGDTLAISSEGDMGVSIDGFSMLRNPTDLKSHVNGLAKELSIRVNPMLQVEIEVTGGSVTAERLPGLARVRVTAGTAKVTDVDGPIDLLVQAGTATLDAQITKGRSRVRVESGAANVILRRGSDVRVHTEAQLGRVSWSGAVSGQSKDVEIGRGRAALDVEVLVGSAQITSD
ncbi:hypothetical protein [Kribbella sp. CA-294648]|uniref:hypothetical protein n=1 Tax=Kribbella sp. CA-294648 TaxID=3239948 RepID=UPI003D8FD5A9